MDPKPSPAGKLLRLRLKEMATKRIVHEILVGTEMLPIGISRKRTFVRSTGGDCTVIIFENEASPWQFLLALDVGWNVRYSSTIRGLRDQRASGVCLKDMTNVTRGRIESSSISGFRVMFNFVDPK